MNSPSISFIYDIKSDIKKLHEGDLFIAREMHEIDEAVASGAFAVVYDNDHEITDDEIAWIKVDDVKNAALKLCRYLLSTLDIEAYYIDKTIFGFASIYKNDFDKDVILLGSSIFDNISLIKSIEEKSSCLLCYDRDIIKAVYPDFKELSESEHVVQNLTAHSLFEISFSHKERFYNRIKLPLLYLNDFLTFTDFIGKHIDTAKLKVWDVFKPVFVDRFLNILENGKSGRFILGSKDEDRAQREIAYLKKEFKYGKSVILAPYGYENKDIEVISYKNDEDIKNSLKTIGYNGIYIIGKEVDCIKMLLNSNDTKSLLIPEQ